MTDKQARERLAAELGEYYGLPTEDLLADWNADIADICEALGHASISMTMRYAHIKPDEHLTAFDRVSASILSRTIDCGNGSATEDHG